MQLNVRSGKDRTPDSPGVSRSLIQQSSGGEPQASFNYIFVSWLFEEETSMVLKDEKIIHE